MSAPSLGMLVRLMVAQVQECVFERITLSSQETSFSSQLHLAQEAAQVHIFLHLLLTLNWTFFQHLVIYFDCGAARLSLFFLFKWFNLIRFLKNGSFLVCRCRTFTPWCSRRWRSLWWRITCRCRGPPWFRSNRNTSARSRTSTPRLRSATTRVSRVISVPFGFCSLCLLSLKTKREELFVKYEWYYSFVNLFSLPAASAGEDEEAEKAISRFYVNVPGQTHNQILQDPEKRRKLGELKHEYCYIKSYNVFKRTPAFR